MKPEKSVSKLIKGYFSGKPAYVSICIGLLAYFAYGFGSSKWNNVWLISTCVFMAVSMRLYSGISNRIDAYLCEISRMTTLGKLGRFAAQVLFNLVLYSLLVHGSVILFRDIEAIGGIPGAAMYTALASQGVQYVAVIIAASGIGTRDWNVLLCMAITVTVTAVSMLGHPEIQRAFTMTSLSLGCILVGAGVFADVRNFITRNKET